AASFLRLGEMSLEIDRDAAQALKYYEESLALRESIVKDSHGDQNGEGIQPRKDSLANLGEAYARVGATRYRLGDVAGGRAAFLAALKSREDLVREYPAEANYSQDLARAYLALAETDFRLGNSSEAGEGYARTVRLREELARDNPKNLFFKRELAGTLGMHAE